MREIVFAVAEEGDCVENVDEVRDAVRGGGIGETLVHIWVGCGEEVKGVNGREVVNEVDVIGVVDGGEQAIEVGKVSWGDSDVVGDGEWIGDGGKGWEWVMEEEEEEEWDGEMRDNREESGQHRDETARATVGVTMGYRLSRWCSFCRPGVVSQCLGVINESERATRGSKRPC